MEPRIELSKTRDFGEIISDSFLFIRQNLKPLLSSFFIFCGFFMLAGTVASIMQQTRMINIFNNADGVYPEGPLGLWAAYGWETLFATVFNIAGAISIMITVISFMALYKEKGNVAPTNEELWGYFKYYFFKIFGTTVLNYIILIISLVFCLIPGIYFSPILGLIFPIMIVENTSYGYAFNQSFKLIKENWWTTFGALVITWIIVSICSGIVSAPFQIVNVWSIFLHKMQSAHLSMLSIIIGNILLHLAQVFYILPLITLSICYFSLTEAKESTGLMSRINQIGTDQPDNNAPSEEY